MKKRLSPIIYNRLLDKQDFRKNLKLDKRTFNLTKYPYTNYKFSNIHYLNKEIDLLRSKLKYIDPDYYRAQAERIEKHLKDLLETLEFQEDE